MPDHDHHEHDGQHSHPHSHSHSDEAIPEHLDLRIPDNELRPLDLSRRSFLRRVGVVGAAAAGASVAGGLPALTSAAAAAGAGSAPAGGYQWLAGDHHIHTQYSPDGQYTVNQQVSNGARYGLDWVVITDHGGVTHQKFSVPQTNADVLTARAALPDLLVFQGLEWNIPSAEHGTVFFAPGPNEVALLTAFEGEYDGVVTDTTASSPANEALAVAGIQWLGDQVRAGKSPAALFLANHPSRKGLDSPHEFRAWRNSDPTVAVGMEGAPGHQAAGIPIPEGPGSGRGYYTNSPTPDSFPAYPPESYVTHGGFDWITATVGGLWDSLLAEGRGWWITSNSDSHMIHNDTLANPTRNNTAIYDLHGKYPHPVDTGVHHRKFGDFAPGYYSRTVVGAQDRRYVSVMDGIRAGRVWVGHGDLIRGITVALEGSAAPITLGGRTVFRRGSTLTLRVAIDLNDTANFNGDRPKLRRLDVIAGAVTGAVADPDSFTTPSTRVVKSFEIGQNRGRVALEYQFTNVSGPFYVRLRGTDGRFTGTPTAVDPAPPRLDPFGNADPWTDLWFYTNPMFAFPIGS